MVRVPLLLLGAQATTAAAASAATDAPRQGKIRLDKTGQACHTIPASLAEWMSDPEPESISCTLTPASETLATCLAAA